MSSCVFGPSSSSFNFGRILNLPQSHSTSPSSQASSSFIRPYHLKSFSSLNHRHLDLNSTPASELVIIIHQPTSADRSNDSLLIRSNFAILSSYIPSTLSPKRNDNSHLTHITSCHAYIRKDSTHHHHVFKPFSSTNDHRKMDRVREGKPQVPSSIACYLPLPPLQKPCIPHSRPLHSPPHNQSELNPTHLGRTPPLHHPRPRRNPEMGKHRSPRRPHKASDAKDVQRAHQDIRWRDDGRRR